ncbi:MAG TPA: hypothetical protein P5217_05165 [Methanoregulaceae archaeon]|nr:hypothetical protein [Methanoregulaceae archaeon]HRY75654.1 hypothetical protein [Methanoregulaceae archaeon]
MSRGYGTVQRRLLSLLEKDGFVVVSDVVGYKRSSLLRAAKRLSQNNKTVIVNIRNIGIPDYFMYKRQILLPANIKLEDIEEYLKKIGYDKSYEIDYGPHININILKSLMNLDRGRDDNLIINRDYDPFAQSSSLLEYYIKYQKKKP